MSPEVDAEGLVPGYETRTIYDAPALTLSRLLDGTVSFDVLRRIWLEPSEDLSPAERQALTDRIKKAVGGGAATSAFVDIISNPFVWFLFITQPAAGTAIKAALKASGGASARLFATEGMQGLVGYARNNFSVLSKLGLLGPDAMLMGTPIGGMVRRVAHLKQDFRKGQEALVSGSIREYLDDLGKRHGITITRLDPSALRHGPAREEMERDLRLMTAHLSGLDGNMPRLNTTPLYLQRVELSDVKTGRPMEAFLSPEDLDLLEKVNLSGKYKGKTLREWDEVRDKRIKFFQKEGGTVERIPGLGRFGDLGEFKIRRYRDADAVGYSSDDTHKKLGAAGVEGSILGVIRAKNPLLGKVVDSYRRYQDQTEVLIHGDEAYFKQTGRYKPDMEKIQRLLSIEAREGVKNSKLRESSFVREMIEGQAKKGGDTAWFSDERILRLLRNKDGNARETFLNKMKGLFWDRYEHIGKGGSRVTGRPGRATDFLDESNNVIDDIGLVDELRKPDSFLGQQADEIPTTWHVDDLRLLKQDLDSIVDSSGNPLSRPNIQWFDEQIGEAGLHSGKMRRVRRLDFQRMVGSYDHRAFRQHVATSPVSTREFNVFNLLRDNPYVSTVGATGTVDLTKAPKFQRATMSITDDGLPKTLSEASDPSTMLAGRGGVEPPGGFSLLDMIETSTEAMRPARPDAAEFVQNVLMPRVMDEMPMRNLLTMSMIIRAKSAGRTLAESSFGRSLSGMHPRAKDVMDRLGEWSKTPVRQVDAGKVLGGTASWLYSSHMGLNVPSVILNLTQPFLNAGSWLGYGNVLASYGDAFKALGSYYQWRGSAAGRAATFAQRNQKIREILDPEDLMGLTDDMMDSIEDPFRTTSQHKGKVRTVLDMTMKPFEKGEWLNRLVTYNATKRVYERALRDHSQDWRSLLESDRVKQGFRTDAETILSNTQFTANIMSTPAALQGGHPMVGKLLANPLGRMFLSFPTRTLTSLVSTSRALGGGSREFLGKEVALGDIPGIGFIAPGFYDMLRMMGFGAILYEGFGAMGMDMKRGVSPYVQGESFGMLLPGGPEGDPRLGIPLPPALNIPFSFVKGLMEKDSDMTRSAIYRLIPGGMGLQRLSGILPDLPGDGWAGNVLQKRYADWGAIQPDGTIPIRDMTGRTIEMPNALEMTMRGLGFDFSRVGGPQELMGYMQKNRERYQEAKWRALRAMRAGNIAESRYIQEDFTSTTGIPLRVTQTDLDRYLKSADQTTPQRMWGTLPIPVRDALRLGPMTMPPMPEDPSEAPEGIPGPFGGT